MNRLTLIAMMLLIIIIMLGLSVIAIKTHDGSGSVGIVHGIMWG